MTTLAVPHGRANIRDELDGFEVIVPARRHVLVVLFLSLWLTGWGMGESFVLQLLIEGIAPIPARLFLLVWLLGWTAGGAFAVYTVLWQISGRERLILRPDALVLRREVLGMGRSQVFDLQRVSRLRALEASGPDVGRAGMRLAGLVRAVILFEYGARSIRFGAGLDPAEAVAIVAQLKQRYSFPESASVA
jgi:hypothetical protein